MKPPGQERARDRLLTDDELHASWQATGDMGAPFGPLFRLLLLTGQRRDEVGEMKWREVDGAKWSIPGSRTKNGEPHTVHLSDPTLLTLATVPRIKGAVALSGGLDFTHLLWKILAQSDAHVHAHFVSHDLGDGGNVHEARAVEQIADLLRREARGFTLTTSRLELRDPGPNLAIRSVSHVAFMVALAAAAAGFGPAALIMTGHNHEDEARLEGERRAGMPTARALIDASVSAVFASIGPAPVATWLEPAPTRAQQVQELPEALVDATWSCRVPVERDGRVRPCGLCLPCLELADVLPRYALGDRYTTMALRLAMVDPRSPLCRALAAADPARAQLREEAQEVRTDT